MLALSFVAIASARTLEDNKYVESAEKLLKKALSYGSNPDITEEIYMSTVSRYIFSFMLKLKFKIVYFSCS